MKNSTSSEVPQLLLPNLLGKFLTKNVYNEHFNLSEAKYLSMKSSNL